MGDILSWAAVIIVVLAVWMLAGRLSSTGPSAPSGAADDVDPLSGRGVL